MYFIRYLKIVIKLANKASNLAKCNIMHEHWKGGDSFYPPALSEFPGQMAEDKQVSFGLQRTVVVLNLSGRGILFFLAISSAQRRYSLIF